MNLPKVIWAYIAEYLCYVDRMALKMTSKVMSRVSLDFKGLVNKKLSKYIDNPDDFCQHLFDSKAVISGSFIIACLYGTDDFNDIDIFDYIEDVYFTQFSNYLYADCGYKYEGHLYGQVYMIREFFIGGKKIQHISLYLEPHAYMDKTFDMDICKSYFDGRKLHVKSWQKLWHRTDYIKPNGLLMRYYIDNINVEALSQSRIDKYKARGFNIGFHPHYQEIKAAIVNEMEQYEDTRFFKQTHEFTFDLSKYD